MSVFSNFANTQAPIFVAKLEKMTMQINHMNLTVGDVQAVRKFLEKYFGLHSMEGTTDDATFVGLVDEKGFVLTLLQGKAEEITYPSAFHFGFLEQGAERVEAIYQQLISDGFEVKPPGYYRDMDLYVGTPWGFTVQVS